MKEKRKKAWEEYEIKIASIENAFEQKHINWDDFKTACEKAYEDLINAIFQRGYDV